MERKEGVKGPDLTDEWNWYERSALSNLLRHDTWPWKLALPSICGIDMDNSGRSDAWGGLMLVDPESERIFGVSFAHVALLSEDPIYQLPPIEEPNNSDLSEYAQRLAAFMQDLQRVDVEVDASDISVRMSNRHRAYMELRQAHKIFMSNPDHAATEAFEPAYYLSWAKSKNIEVPWLNWAQDRGLVDIANRPSPSSAIQRDRTGHTLDRRAETTYLNIIGALLEVMFDKSSLNKSNSIFNNQTDVINALLDKYGSKRGIKQRTLEQKFSEANKSISQE